MRLHSEIAALMVGAAATFSVAPMSISAAQAAPGIARDDCSAWRPGNNGEGTWVMNIDANLKVAFYSSCPNVTYLHKGDVLYEQCYSYNSYDNVWVYVRVAGTSTYGWMYMGNMNMVLNDEDGDGAIREVTC